MKETPEPSPVLERLSESLSSEPTMMGMEGRENLLSSSRTGAAWVHLESPTAWADSEYTAGASNSAH